MICRFGRYRIDTDRLELRRGDELIKVEPQVFRIIVYLIENRERIVSKDELINTVWEGRIVSDATLNTRINAARRAVGDSGKRQEVIRTFPKHGFRFVSPLVEFPDGAREQSSNKQSHHRIESEYKQAPSSKPLIGVLPFVQIGEDDEGFGHGLVGLLVNGLSRRDGIEVVGSKLAPPRQSDTLPDPAEIRRELRADYFLSGTVYRKGAKIRITVELFETVQGKEIWAERYDRDFDDPMRLQDEIEHAILVAIYWNLAARDGERVAQKPVEFRTTSDRLSQAAQCFYTATPASYDQAEAYLDDVLDSEPRNAMALAMRAFAIFVRASYSAFRLDESQAKRAVKFAETSLLENERSFFAHWIRGTLALNLDRNNDLAMRHCERSLEINTDYAPALRLKGEILCFAGDTEQGIPILRSLLAADPRAPANAIVFWDLALAYFAIADTKPALWAIDNALVRMRTMPDLFLTKAAILENLDRRKEAREIVKKIKKVTPKVLTLDDIRLPPFASQAVIDRYLNALRLIWTD